MPSDFNDFECNDFEKLLFADPGSRPAPAS